MLDLHHVRTFVAVAATCNFTRAAKQLGCSQPTVTLHIRTLERQLGAILLERKRFSQAHSLTAVGSQVYEYSVKLLSLVDEIPEVVSKLTDAGVAVAPPQNVRRQAGLSIAATEETLESGSDLTELSRDASPGFIRHSLRHKPFML